MKTNSTFQILVLLIIGLSISIGSIFGQDKKVLIESNHSAESYSLLDRSKMQTDILYAEGNPIFNAEYGKVISSSQADQLYYQIAKATSNGTFPSLKEFKHRMNRIHEETGAVPLSLLDVVYDDFKSNVLEDKILVLEDGKLVPGENSLESPFEMKELLVLGIHLSKLSESNVNFYFDETTYFSNRSPYDEIYIDFDNGKGYEILNNGITSVSYSEIEGDKIIKVKVKRGGKYTEASTQAKSAACTPNATLLPELQGAIDLGLGGMISAWEFEIQVEGTSQKGNAYTKWSADGILDKPFIFVEGIDFGYDHLNQRNGEFGWCEFTGGSVFYSMLDDSPYLLDSLLNLGYDLILLDFFNGGDYIERNGELLKELIRKVNLAKVGSYPNVIAGASMGGQVSRYALKQMEDEGENHCTGTWISLDSPHNGANVPIGLQDFIEFAAPFSSPAANFIDEYLERPAARQLLYLQNFGPSIFGEYYNMMDELGYPERTLNIGIANGNGNATFLPFNSGAALLDWECDAGIFNDVAKMYIAATPGSSSHPDYDPSDPEFRVTANFKITEQSGLSIYSFEGTSFRNLLNHPRYDLVPGGTRASMKQLVTSTNPSLSDAGCPIIQSWQYIEDHSFVPTTSALGVAASGYGINVNNLWSNSPELFPFDVINMSPDGINEEHSEITIEDDQNNADFILNQLLIASDPIGGLLSSLSPNNGVFNYGKAGDLILYPVDIQMNGNLHINANLYTHFGQGSEMPASNHLVMYTSGCSGDINIFNNSMNIGDVSGSRTADVHITDGSSIRLHNAGILNIYPGSKLVIESGAQLLLSGGTLNMYAGAEIVIESGAEIFMEEEGPIAAADGLSYIRVYGAMNAGTGNDFILSMNGGNKILPVFYSTSVNLKGNNGSRFDFTGLSIDDVIVQIASGGQMVAEWSLTEVELNSGQVRMSGEIRMQCKLDANEVKFTTTTNKKLQTETTINLDDCLFVEVDILANMTGIEKVIANTTSFTEDSEIIIEGGSLRIQDCFFTGDYGTDAIQSYHLTSTSVIQDCHFETLRNGINDESISQFNMYRNYFTDCEIGIFKNRGSLLLKCNEFRAINEVAIEAMEGCDINMSSRSGGGYNDFSNNLVNLHLIFAGELFLEQGYNTFGPAALINMEGYYEDSNCPGNASVYLPAFENAWGWGGTAVGPNQNDFNLHTNNGCDVNVHDTSPIVDVECGHYSTGANSPIRRSSSLEDNQMEFELYPNPSNGSFILSNVKNGEQASSVEIYSSLGQLVYSQSVANQFSNKGILQLNTNLSPGVYQISIYAANSRETIRLVIE